MSTLEKKSLFPETLIPELINNVKGKSSIARLSASTPIAFNGQKEFTFTLDKEVDIVAESGAKSAGGATMAPITIVPVKVEYSARVSDEFLYAAEEYKLDVLSQFSVGLANKIARGFDIMAMHGFNPRTGKASTVIGNNHFDKAVTNVVTQSEDTNANDQVEAAIALVQGAENEVTGMAMAPAFKSELAAITKADGNKMFPELKWGAAPSELNGLAVDSNSTVSFSESKDKAIVGDFANRFKWGYAKEIPLEVIQYGNPDNDEEAGDLKGHNQVLLRAEAYIGWGILDPSSFAIVRAATE